MWDFGAKDEQHSHWSLENPLLERFSVLDVWKFAATGFVSSSLLCAEKRQKEQTNWQIQRLCQTDLAHCFVETGADQARNARLSLLTRIDRNGGHTSACGAVSLVVLQKFLSSSLFECISNIR